MIAFSNEEGVLNPVVPTEVLLSLADGSLYAKHVPVGVALKRMS